MIYRIALIACLGLTACAETEITEYNGNSIRIKSASSKVTPDVVSEAQRICRTQGLKAEFASTTSLVNDYFTHYHLFLCLTQTKRNAGLPQGIMRTPNYLETTATL